MVLGGALDRRDVVTSLGFGYSVGLYGFEMSCPLLRYGTE